MLGFRPRLLCCFVFVCVNDVTVWASGDRDRSLTSSDKSHADPILDVNVILHHDGIKSSDEHEKNEKEKLGRKLESNPKSKSNHDEEKLSRRTDAESAGAPSKAAGAPSKAAGAPFKATKAPSKAAGASGRNASTASVRPSVPSKPSSRVRKRRPVFLTASDTSSFEAGKTTTLHCTVKDLGKRKIIWIRNEDLVTAGGKKFTSDPRVKLEEKVSSSGSSSSALTISNLTDTDIGGYKCQINTDPPMTLEHSLDVWSYPSIKLPKSPVIKNTGSDVTLQCLTTGIPKPKVIWAKLGGSIPYGATDGDKLHFKKVRKDDGGSYMCIASNGRGPSRRKGLTLEVGSPPEDIDFRSPVQSRRATSYELEFRVKTDAPMDRGRLRLRELNRESGATEKEETIMFYPKNEDVGLMKTEQIVLKALRPSSKYEIRLQVKSKFGPSQVSPPFFFFSSSSDFGVSTDSGTEFGGAGLPLLLPCDFFGTEAGTEHAEDILVEAVLWYFLPRHDTVHDTRHDTRHDKGHDTRHEDHSGKAAEDNVITTEYTTPSKTSSTSPTSPMSSAASAAPPQRRLLAMRSRYPRFDNTTRFQVFESPDRITFNNTFKPCSDCESETRGSASLLLHHLAEDQLGTYECEVDLRYVHPGPQIRRKSVKIQVRDAADAPFMNPKVSGYDGDWTSSGDRLSLQCGIDAGGRLPSKMMWMRDGHPVHFAETFTNVSQSLTFSFNILEEDRGSVFSCHLEHPLHGVVNVSLPDLNVYRPMEKLTVTYAPAITWHSVAALVDLRCDLGRPGFPPATLAWRRGAEVVKTSAAGADFLTLDVTTRRGRDANEWTCVAEQRSTKEDGAVLASSSLPVRLQVAYGPNATTLRIEGHQNVTIGTEASFRCVVADAFPAVAFAWTKDGLPVFQEASYGFSSQGNTFIGTLTFLVLEKDDGAEISCLASNPALNSTVHVSTVLSVSYDFYVFSNATKTSAFLGDDAVLHCDYTLPDSRLQPHLLTQTLSWYKLASKTSKGKEPKRKGDVQIQVPDYMSVSDLHFFIGSKSVYAEEYMEDEEPEAEKRVAEVTVFKRKDVAVDDAHEHDAHSPHGHHAHRSSLFTRQTLILSHSKYPMMDDYEKLSIKKDPEKYSLSGRSSLHIRSVSDADVGMYACEVDLHYVPIPPAPQNLKKSIFVELMEETRGY